MFRFLFVATVTLFSLILASCGGTIVEEPASESDSTAEVEPAATVKVSQAAEPTAMVVPTTTPTAMPA